MDTSSWTPSVKAIRSPRWQDRKLSEIASDHAPRLTAGSLDSHLPLSLLSFSYLDFVIQKKLADHLATSRELRSTKGTQYRLQRKVLKAAPEI